MSRIKNLIRSMDLFARSQFLRYKSYDQYRTMTGGVVSLIFLLIFIGIFSKLTLDTLNRTIITSTVQNINGNGNQPLVITIGPQNKFMFAVQLGEPDLFYYDNISQLFEIVVISSTMVNNHGNGTIILMEECNSSHWSGISETVTQYFSQVDSSGWLCPKIGQKISLTSQSLVDTSQLLSIQVFPCSSYHYCYPNVSQILQSSFSSTPVFLSIYFVNSIINPTSQDYLDYYIQDTQYLTFDYQIGSSGRLQFSPFSITTDQSLLPFEDNQVDNGIIQNDVMQILSFTVNQNWKYTNQTLLKNNNPYGQIDFLRSSNNIIIDRAYQKIEVVFASISGLFGATLVCLFFLNFFNRISYELQLGERNFRDNQNKGWGSQQFNLLVFFGYLLYKIIKIACCRLRWRRMDKYQQCRAQTQKQLDVHTIFQKIRFLEQVAHLVLEDYHIVGLNLRDKPKINQMVKNRKKYLLRQILYFQFDQLSRKGIDIMIELQDYQDRFGKFEQQYEMNEVIQENMGTLREIVSKSQHFNYKKSNFLKDNLKSLIEKSSTDNYCKKIMKQLYTQNIYKIAKQALEIQQKILKKDATVDLKLSELSNREKRMSNSRKDIEGAPNPVLNQVQQ